MSDTMIDDDDNNNISADDLKRMLSEARSQTRAARERAERAEADRDAATSRVASATEDRFAAQKAAVAGRKSAAESAVEAAKRELKEAFAAGDADALAAAQEKLADARYDAREAAKQDAWLDSNKEQMTRAPQQRQAPADKYAAVGIVNLLPAERDFLDRHPEVLTDRNFRERIIGASRIANADGHERGTDSYFREIERVARLRSDDGDRVRSGYEPEADEPREPPQRRESADVPPQRRTPGTRTQGEGREIKLTQDQMEVAEILYGNPSHKDQYLPNKADRIKKYAKNFAMTQAMGKAALQDV